MKRIEKELSVKNLTKIQENFLLKNPLLFDIETTGFSAKTTSLYLIGSAYFSENKLCFIQFFATSPDEEPELLEAFKDLCENFQLLGSFNALGFDIPYLKHKYASYHMDCSFLDMAHYDIYKLLYPYKALFGLENFKQKTIECWLENKRNDPYSGGELIATYKKYVKSPSEHARNDLLLHNEEDVHGIFALANLLSYKELFAGEYSNESYEIHAFKNFEEQQRTEIRISFTTKFPVPQKINFRKNHIQLYLNDCHGMLTTECVNDHVKFYYDNYKDYYYFPDEDRAIHKSLASFANKNDRIKATKDTAYQYISIEQLAADGSVQLHRYVESLLGHLL